MAKLVTFLILAASLYAVLPDGYWASQDSATLEKDEVVAFEVDGRLYTFRWTLYINDGLVVLVKYDNFPYQTVLYRDYRLSGFRVDLKTPNRADVPPPYMMVDFQSIDANATRARFGFYLYDPSGRVVMKRLEQE